MPAALRELLDDRATASRAHYKDMQDIEFTIERGKLYMLQTRTGKRTGLAALNIAFDFQEAGVLDARGRGAARSRPDMLVQLLAPIFAPKDLEAARRSGGTRGRKGLPAGPGAASGVIAFTAERAVRDGGQGEEGPAGARGDEPRGPRRGWWPRCGIVTEPGRHDQPRRGGGARDGKPCIVGRRGARSSTRRRGRLRGGKTTLREGDASRSYGHHGRGHRSGQLDPHPLGDPAGPGEKTPDASESPSSGRFARAHGVGRRARARLKVRTNADTPHDARGRARLSAPRGSASAAPSTCSSPRTASPPCGEMILADDDAPAAPRPGQAAAHAARGLRRASSRRMDGLPVTIRLLDPPLPRVPRPTRAEQFRKPGAAAWRSRRSSSRKKARQLHEANPMLGHRGCRLGITFPDIYEMQVRAIFEAAAALRRQGRARAPRDHDPAGGSVRRVHRPARR